jgi:hypothetical protein
MGFPLKKPEIVCGKNTENIIRKLPNSDKAF